VRSIARDQVKPNFAIDPVASTHPRRLPVGTPARSSYLISRMAYQSKGSAQ